MSNYTEVDSKDVIAGDLSYGFMGEVKAEDLFTGSELAGLVGISQGTSQHSDEPWLKFSYENKILFVAKKPIRSHISWDAINVANCVYGGESGAVVEKDGYEFTVRLLKGALTDPSKYDESDRGAKGSEWNRLMLPIHEESVGESWGYPQYVEDDIPSWNHGLGSGESGFYGDSDLLTHNSYGNGSYSWCQETRNTNASNRVNRGNSGVSHSHTNSEANAISARGWRPVLEIEQKDLFSSSKTLILSENNAYSYDADSGIWVDNGEFPSDEESKMQLFNDFGMEDTTNVDWNQLKTVLPNGKGKIIGMRDD